MIHLEGTKDAKV